MKDTNTSFKSVFSFFKFLMGFTLIGVFLINSCDTYQKIDEPLQMHRSYYPVDTGNEYTFRVDSIYYDEFNNKIDTFQFVEKWVFQKKTQLNDTAQYQIKQIVKDSLNSDPSKEAFQTLRKNDEAIQLFANNQRTIKLIFPVQNGKEWDGNVYNAEPEQNFRYEDVHEPFSGENFAFDSTITVYEQDEGNLIERQLQKVTYAKNVGPVYQETMDLAFRGDSIPPEDIPWEEKANTGYILKYRLVAFQVGP